MARRSTCGCPASRRTPRRPEPRRSAPARFGASSSTCPARVAIGGFSDGASYALSLGLANGAVFRSILAFSPGFNAAPRRAGTPRVFIAHGLQHTVLSIEHTSRRLVAVPGRVSVAFDGPHTVPSPIVTRALAWWLDGRDGT
jgi:phospholipase/carboxylesterase